MKILLSWSGRQSKFVAGALRDWLVSVVPDAVPWMSASDISPGTRWFNEVMNQLFAAEFCIICLTPDNMRSPWLYFEAGAIAAKSDRPRVCGFLTGVNPSQLAPGPFSQFQCIDANFEGTWQLVCEINRNLKSPHNEILLNAKFIDEWPALKTKLEYALLQYDPTSSDSSQETDALKPRYALSRESLAVLLEAANDRNGVVIMTRTMDGLVLQTNGKQLAERKNPRSEAIWQGALRKLVQYGLLESRGAKGEVFGITSEGYRVADEMRAKVPQVSQSPTE